MKDQELVKGLPSISPSIDLCEKCILGKMNRKKFENDKATKASQPLQLMYSDNGGEYNSNEFNAFCAKYGIKRQFTIPYAPQQNDVIEKK